MKILFLFYVLFLLIFNLNSQIKIKESSGWLETAYATWLPVENATSYEVYYSGEGIENKKIDDPLIRSYGSYFRADIPGLKAGTYTIKIVPVIQQSANPALESSTEPLQVKAHNREGFAFINGVVPGAYNMDGTPKTGAIILYLTDANANTLTCEVKNDKGVATTYTGIMNILANRGKGYDKTPLIIRMIGTVKNIQNLNNNNFFYFGGFNNSTRLIENITVEGIGNDATAYGFGFGFKRSKAIEIRNIGIMMFGDDGVGMDTDNFNIWIHNCDFFYGKPGADADQVKGDGSIDMKYNSTAITLSYNHFWDSGKVMGCGGATGEDNNLLITFHHNWFDHADSRCPRLTNTNAHIYNNYYDGVAKYSVGTAYNVSAFVESNYFRGGQRPMTISGQGTDTYNSSTGQYTLEGTFSGQAGGLTKSYNNKMVSVIKFVDQSYHPVQFDAYTVNSRSEKIPATVKSFNGSYVYNNFDTDAAMYISNPESPEDARLNVINYAGRMQGGDLKWTFNNDTDDMNTEVNIPLKNAVVNYQSGLKAIQGMSAINTDALPLMEVTVNVYPNPVNDFMQIVSDKSVNKIEIYNSSGVLVFNDHSGNESYQLSNLKPGVYIVVVDTEKRIIRKLIIKI